nr:class I SAM-dependent methyltransferase [Planctomycetota bacterium]
MSDYENYSTTSLEYDATRIPFGVDTILHSFEQTGIPLTEQSILEAGCGTGNYLRALQSRVGSLTGIDFSEGMLDQARAKLGDKVEFACGSVLEMPFDEGQFDGITCNQVLHHLDEGPTAADDPAAWPESGAPNVTRFVEEAFRVLKPGGALIINTASHEQMRDAYWWAGLIPVAVARVACRMPDVEPLTRILATTGFQVELVEADLDGILQGEAYLDPTGPLRESWRAGDSTWSLTTDEELSAACERVERMTEDGSMELWLKQREEKRKRLGQSTFVCG